MGQLGEARFGRVLTAMVTPFHADGSLDLPGAARLARHLVAHGSDGLVINGTTGESATLTSAESVAMFRAVREAVDVPILAGTGSNDTAHAVQQSKAAADVGVDGLLVVTPYYNRPSQAGLLAHFRAVAQATPLPVVLYDIPARSGRKLETPTILALAHDLHNVVALKDAAGNPAETARVIASAPEGFQVYSGDDGLTLPLLSVGAVGVIGVATHWAGRLIEAMIEAFDAGNAPLARAINARLLPSYAFESTVEAPNPVPAKAMLRTLGLPAGQCRLPMGDAPDGLEAEARRVWAEVEAAEAAL
jgi:4-hydroxy-tetrahydrodipicolinate synthase